MDTGQTMQCAGQCIGYVARHVAWVVEPHGVALIHLAHGRRRELGYPEAAVWDLVSRGRPEERICSMLEAIAGIGPHEARALVDSCLAQWLAEGWLVAERVVEGQVGEGRLVEDRLETGGAE